MAFKQKSGSPFQRNFGIGKSPAKHKAAEGEISPVSGATAKQHNKTYGTPKHHDDPRKGKRTSEMKSPMKQDERPWYKKAWDEATQIGEGLKSEVYKGSYGGSPDPIGSRFMKGYTSEERKDDPVIQQELLKKEELKKKENRRIEIEQDKQSDIIKAENKLKFEEDSKHWSEKTKKKYLNEDGSLKKEYESIWGFGEDARYRDGKKEWYSEEYDSWN